MEHGKNTVAILYRVLNANHQTKLILTPLLNFRDFHKDSYNHEFEIEQYEENRKLKTIIDKNTETPIYINVSDGKYVKHENDSFKNMFYIEEEKRGFNSEENHLVPGRYEIEIKPNEQKDITFVASLEHNIEEIDAKEIINKEITRISEIVYDAHLEETNKDKDLIKDYIIAADNFVAYRPSFKLHTIIAGYPWFLDWGRDTLISFEGLLLKTKRYKIAKEVLLTMIRDIKYGLVPNGYSGYDNRPLYNSVDSSLLLFEQIQKYINYTKDYDFIKEKIYPVLPKIIESYCNGIDIDNNNIYLDDDGLISSGTETTQNTWMDAKIGNYVVTPRNGKAVEINSLWYNALCIMADFAKLYKEKDLEKKYVELAKKCKKSFEEKFYNKKRKSLDDLVGDNKIRPNQLFAIGLYYPVIDPQSDIAKQVLETVTKKLLTPYGLKTLAKGEPGYREIYEGDVIKRDMSYHQGITWPWLLGIYIDSLIAVMSHEKNKTKKKEYQERYTFTKEMYQRSTCRKY